MIASLSAEQRDIILDLGQLTLDVAGIFDPTPVADLTSAVVSVVRGAWSAAAISLVATVPFWGDLAKLGSLPRYVEIVERAIRAARQDRRFAAVLRPLLHALDDVLARVPLDAVSTSVQGAMRRLRRLIADYAPASANASARIDRLTEQLLQRVLGSTVNVAAVPRRNARTLVEFFAEHNVDGGDLERWAALARGVDLHALEPVQRQVYRKGTKFVQYVDTMNPKGVRVGQWMVRVRGAPPAGSLGISSRGRERRVFVLTEDRTFLVSRAQGTVDVWSHGLTKALRAPVLEDGKWVMKDAELVTGGADQYFLPQAWMFLKAE